MKTDIIINGNTVKAEKGEKILDVLKRIGINIPTLCYLKNMMPTGACRMCLVENKVTGKLITACSYPVEDNMNIMTHSPRVLNARKTIVELLLSNHPDDCLYCPRNLNCELQGLADNLGVDKRKIRGKKNKFPLDYSSPSLLRDPDKCILCGRCVRVCEETIGVACIDFIHRGSETIIGATFNKGLNTSSCVNCGQCLMVCPTGAITEKSHIENVVEALNNPELKVVVQYAPAVTVSIAEEFGLEPGKDMNGSLNAALRKIGFNNVFDTSFTADLTIMEEVSELIHRIVNKGRLPMITSCCPAWVKYAEEFYPELMPNISSCKSPQQMMGAIIKSYFAQTEKIEPEKIYSVSIMPCTAKKFESQREEMTHHGISDVDAVLTTRELAKLIKIYGIDIKNIEPELTDSPLGTRTSAGKIFGASGGVMEAAIRTAYYKLTGKELVNFRVKDVRGFNSVKETKINIDGLEVGVAVINGLGNAKPYLDEIKKGNKKDIHFIEVMSCPGGCIAGGGQHIGADIDSIFLRAKSLYDIDDRDSLKASHQNMQIKELYDKFLISPLGHLSHELLHTTYTKREVLK
jgi:iron-only hydrogenase group A